MIILGSSFTLKQETEKDENTNFLKNSLRK